MFSWKFCKILKNTFFTEQLRGTAVVNAEQNKMGFDQVQWHVVTVFFQINIIYSLRFTGTVLYIDKREVWGCNIDTQKLCEIVKKTNCEI